MRSAALGAALLVLCAGCSGGEAVVGQPQPSSSAAAPSSSSAGTPTGPRKAEVTMRFRPVLRTDAAATGSDPAATTAGATPASQEQAAAEYDALTCAAGTPSPDDAPAGYLAACSEDGSTRYLLGPAIVDSSRLTDAQARRQEESGAWVVEVTFDAAGGATWASYTAANTGSQVAITIDGRVLSAPVIQGTIEGPTQISGNFDEQSARRLAAQLVGH